MGLLDQATAYSHSGGVIGGLGRIFLRFFQFVLALTVAGLYGVDLNNARKAGVYADGRWVYAEVVAALAAVTTLVYAVPFIKSYVFFGWDAILFILWTALFGIFGKLWIHEHPTPHQPGSLRMKNAVWVDLTNMILWFATAVWGAITFSFGQRRTMYTGRAKA
ncbi:hypothetical protein LTR66_003564 [Elasticomyces elasticus]|nr:hypothetical protein LTR66_003564 [Elasticomyces elasticus]